MQETLYVMNREACCAMENVSSPPRTNRAILRGKQLSLNKKTMRPNAPRWVNQQIADYWWNSVFLSRRRTFQPTQLHPPHMTDSTEALCISFRFVKQKAYSRIGMISLGKLRLRKPRSHCRNT